MVEIQSEGWDGGVSEGIAPIPASFLGGRRQPANLGHINGSLALFSDCIEPILQMNPHYNALILNERTAVS